MKLLNEVILEDAQPHDKKNSDQGMNSSKQKICLGMGAQAYDEDRC